MNPVQNMYVTCFNFWTKKRKLNCSSSHSNMRLMVLYKVNGRVNIYQEKVGAMQPYFNKFSFKIKVMKKKRTLGVSI